MTGLAGNRFLGDGRKIKRGDRLDSVDHDSNGQKRLEHILQKVGGESRMALSASVRKAQSRN
jgi:hypothetical protein